MFREENMALLFFTMYILHVKTRRLHFSCLVIFIEKKSRHGINDDNTRRAGRSLFRRVSRDRVKGRSRRRRPASSNSCFRSDRHGGGRRMPVGPDRRKKYPFRNWSRMLSAIYRPAKSVPSPFHARSTLTISTTC